MAGHANDRRPIPSARELAALPATSASMLDTSLRVVADDDFCACPFGAGYSCSYTVP